MTDQTTPYQSDSRALIFTLPLTVALTIGTGGNITAEYCKHQKDGIVFNGHGGAAIDRFSVASPADELTRIKTTLKLTVSELAGCIGVSRQSIYNWKSGSEIKARNAEKFENLKNAADVISAAGFDIPAFTLARKLPGGSTLLETISAGGDGKLAAQSLLQMLNQESVERKMLSEQIAQRMRPEIDNNIIFGV
ncbi:MAG: helix-turn-helix transcriptional regulator [Xanthobacteraceae bacterium]|jgi:transcriptional regulator with XRE-family HTH domain